MANNISFGAKMGLDNFSIKQTASISNNFNTTDTKLRFLNSDTEIGFPNFAIVKVNGSITFESSTRSVNLTLDPGGTGSGFELLHTYIEKDFTVYCPFEIIYTNVQETSIRADVEYSNSTGNVIYNWNYNPTTNNVIIARNQLYLNVHSGNFNGTVTINFYSLEF